MRYEKPTIELMGDAHAVVLGKKCRQPVQDNVAPCFIQSLGAYEADE